MSIVAFIIVIICAHFLGRMTLKALRLNDLDPITEYLYSFALGFMIMSGIAFLMLTLHIGNRGNVSFILYVGALVGLIKTSKDLQKSNSAILKLAFEKGKHLRRLFSWLIINFLGVTFYMALAPTTAWDGLTYHYPLAAQWLQAGRFFNITGIIYSNFPSSTELVYMFGFAANSEITANLITWFAGFLCIVYLLHFGKRYFTPEAGLAAGIILLSYPVVYVEELQGGYIDLFHTFYIFALLDALILFASERSPRNALLAGLMSGFGLCIKHTGLLTSAFVFIYILIILLRKSPRAWKVFFTINIFLIITYALPIGWYIKSYIYTGNPVYPFLYHEFGGKYSSAPDIMYWANPKVVHDIWLTLLYPIKATFDIPMVQLKFRLLPPTLLALLPFIFLKFRRNEFSWMALFYAIYFVVLISLLEPGEPRYNLGAWALLGLIAVDSAMRFSGKAKWFGRIVIPLIIIIPLAAGSVDISRRLLNYRGQYITEERTREEYYLGDKERVPLDVYAMVNEINKLTSETHGKVLMGDPRIFVIGHDVDWVIAYPFQTETLWDWDKVRKEDVPVELRNRGFKYIAISYGAHYRGICEAWFLMNGTKEVALYNPAPQRPKAELGMGSSFFETTASYSNPHLSVEDRDWDKTLVYDGRFADVDALFQSKGNVDVKFPAAIMWMVSTGDIKKVYSCDAGDIFEVMD